MNIDKKTYFCQNFYILYRYASINCITSQASNTKLKVYRHILSRKSGYSYKIFKRFSIYAKRKSNFSWCLAKK